MDRETAILILTDLQIAAKALDKAELTARDHIQDKAESMRFRRALATVAASFTDATYRIFEEHPDLKW